MIQNFSRASALRDCLTESEAIANGANNVLQSYSGQLESLIKSVEHVADRAQVLSTAQKRVDNALKQASQLLQHLDTPSRVEAKIKQGPKAGLSEFLTAVGRLDECIKFLSKHRDMRAVEKSLRIGLALQKEAITLELDDFHACLKKFARVIEIRCVTADADAFKPEALSNTQNILPAESVEKVKRLHQSLNSLGDTSSIKAFCEARCLVLDKSMLAGLGLKLLTPEEFNKLSWAAAEQRIRVWIEICLGTFGQLAIEQRLMHQVFGRKQGMDAYQQLMVPVVQLLHIRFIAKILGYRQVPEKVYGLLEAGEQLQGRMSNLDFNAQKGSAAGLLESQFAAQSGYEIYSKKGQFSAALAEQARSTFNHFRFSLKQEAVRQSVGSALVHRLTVQVMTMLKRLVKYTSCPHILFSEDPIPHQPFARASFNGPHQEVAMRQGLEKLLELCWDTLVGIASYCKNKAMACLFLMTNAHYQVKTVQMSAALQIISKEWQDKCETRLEEYGQKYQQHAWGSILELIDDPDQAPNMKALSWLKDKSNIKEKWKKINMLLGALISEQKHWSISDRALRTNLQNAIVEDFIPVYERFWNTQQTLKFTAHPGKYFRYSPKALTDIIRRELFQTGENAMEDVSVRPGHNSQDIRILREAALAADEGFGKTASSSKSANIGNPL